MLRREFITGAATLAGITQARAFGIGSMGRGIGNLGSFRRASLPFSQNLTAATTTKLLAGYQAMLAGTRNMTLAIMGDSTDRGVDETASPYNSQYRLSLAEQLASRFRADGIASGANNIYGISGNTFSDYMLRDGRCAATGATTAFGTAVPCQGGAEIEFPTAAGTFSFTPQENTNTGEIYYQDSTAGRAFNWNADGGSNTLLTTTGLNTIVRAVVPLGSVASHTVNLAWSAGFVRIYGIDCYDNTRKEITIRQWAISGGTTSSMIDNTGTPSSGRLRQLALFPVDCVFGDLGLVNSWRNSRSVANCQTDIDTMIDAIKAAGGDFIFCVPPFDSGSTGATANQQQYIDMAISRCLVKGCAVFNIRQAWGSKAAADAAGYMSAADAVHPTIAGQASRAALLKPILRYGMGLNPYP